MRGRELDMSEVKDMSAFAPEVQPQAKALALLIAQKVREYFMDEDHRREFEAWYMAKYGEPYIWRSVSGA